MRLAGYGLADEPQPVRVATGSQVETMARVTLSRFAALGEERLDFPVLAHELPPGMSVAGLLGLDFLRGHVLIIASAPARSPSPDGTPEPAAL